MSLFDEIPYPWTRREARELHVALLGLYPSERAALHAAKRVSIEAFDLSLGGPVRFLWTEILETALVKGRLRDLVEVALAENDKSPSASILKSLLAGAMPVLDAQPRKQDGSAEFLSGTDEVTEPEALLFHDDLSMSVGRVPGLIATLQEMVRLAPGVCLLHVTAGPVSTHGTGFRIGADLFLTNHHVLFPYDYPPSKIGVELGFETDANDHGLASRTEQADLGTVVTSPEDDWAVFRVPSLDPAYTIFDPSRIAVAVRGEPSFIIQHPGAERKRLAFVRNTITEVGARTLYYLTDTQAGSSGSPVLDAEGRLLGLHRAGGTPREVIGKPPVTKNEGVLIATVLGGLRSKGILPV